MLLTSSKRLAHGITIGSFFLFIVSGFIIGCTGAIPTVPVMGTPRDPNIRYIGRWDTSNSSVYNSYWPGAYLKTGFTGTTAKIKLIGFSSMYVSVDNGPETMHYIGSGGIVNATPVPLKAGTHTLRLAIANDTDTIHFKGLILDAGATTVAPAMSSQLIEFIGDSITVGATDTNYALSDYAWLASEHLSFEHTQIAEGGMCLVDNVQCSGPSTVGMSRQYFALQTSYFNDSINWDFSRYQATAVVINLGTNDHGDNVGDAVFQAAYITFLHNIRAKYPHALIFAMEPFNGAEAMQIQNAVIAATDPNVHYISTTGWLRSGSDDYAFDGTHPTDAGQIKVAKRLEPILAAALGKG